MVKRGEVSTWVATHVDRVLLAERDIQPVLGRRCFFLLAIARHVRWLLVPAARHLIVERAYLACQWENDLGKIDDFAFVFSILTSKLMYPLRRSS